MSINSPLNQWQYIIQSRPSRNHRMGFPDFVHSLVNWLIAWSFRLFIPQQVSGLRAINIVCVVVAYNAFSCYGTLLATLSFYDETVSTSVSVKKSITSVLVFLFIAEMFCGVWLALLNKEVMFLWSTPPIQHQVKQVWPYFCYAVGNTCIPVTIAD